MDVLGGDLPNASPELIWFTTFRCAVPCLGGGICYWWLRQLPDRRGEFVTNFVVSAWC